MELPSAWTRNEQSKAVTCGRDQSVRVGQWRWTEVRCQAVTVLQRKASIQQIGLPISASN